MSVLPGVGAKPLLGRRVVVTRPRAEAARLAELLQAYGAEVEVVPTIRLEPPDSWEPLDRALDRLSEYDWVVFTSANGAAAVRARLAATGRDGGALAGSRVAAIGPRTAEALRRWGVRVELIPGEFRAEALVETLRPHVAPGMRVLIPRAQEARELLPEALRALGASVTVAPAYRTVVGEEGIECLRALLEAGRVDVVTFTSSSTVRNFMALFSTDQLPRLLRGVALAAIGPITAGTVAEYGFTATIVPRQYTVPALAEAVAAHFARPKESP
ncbi:MAG: uroporphyrinogen-III synthase [Candidatus Rokubacteria bacterium]|nr:uroporphyrinogen-III synthase [Candidatus Rokubacteria bacterium]